MISEASLLSLSGCCHSGVPVAEHWESRPSFQARHTRETRRALLPRCFQLGVDVPRVAGRHPSSQPEAARSLVQEAAQYLPKGCSRKMPPYLLLFNAAVCSNTLFSNTSVVTNSLSFRAYSTFKGSQPRRLVEHFWVPILGASCSNILLLGTVRPSQLSSGESNLLSWRGRVISEKGL